MFGVPVFRTDRRRTIATVIAAACLLVPVLAHTGAHAQTPPEKQPTREDIAVRDNLIADQETLLNIYRCQFNIDTHAVIGGCTDGQPTLGRTQPGPFESSPTRQDIEVRDNLIADLEWLLNAYRCQFNIDIEIVPDGCDAPSTQSEPPDLATQAEIIAAETEMAQLVNELRQSLGLAPLAYNIELANVARGWSETMRDTGQFAHNPFYTLQYPPGWQRAGENLATVSGTTLLEAVQIAFAGLATSPGHYANMTHPDINQFGIGIATQGSSVWMTQNFAYYP